VLVVGCWLIHWCRCSGDEPALAARLSRRVAIKSRCRSVIRVKKYLAIVVFVIVATIGFWLPRDDIVSESFTYGHTARINTLGRDLIERRQSKLIIGVQPALHTKLDQLGIGTTLEYFSVPVRGDAPSPIGDGQATHHLYVRRMRDNRDVLGVRLQYERRTHTYHVLGFWTPTTPTQTLPAGGSVKGFSLGHQSFALVGSAGSAVEGRGHLFGDQGDRVTPRFDERV
jgi:hypothetical protein